MRSLLPLVWMVACGPSTPVPVAPAVVRLVEDTSDPVRISVVVENDRDLADYEVTITTPPEHGELDGTTGPAPLGLIYTPDADFYGTDSLEFVVRAKRGKREAHGGVAFVVDPAPDLPVAADDAVATSDRTPIDVDVVDNDVDPDGEALLVTAVTTPAIGTTEITSARIIRYTPVVGATGAHTFDYTVQDPTGRTSSATVTVTVSAEAAVAIPSFTASPLHPDPGDAVTLAWASTGATSCALDPGAAAVATSGSTVVAPTGPVTYLLTCQGPGGPAVAVTRVVPWGEDADGDGINDLLELDLGLDPTNPDTDGDGLYDGDEVRTDPLDPDSDDDGWLDGEEDLDRDGLVGPAETDPADPDSDGDGVCDGPRFDDDGDGVGPADGCVDPAVWHVEAGGVGDGSTWASPMGLAAALAAAGDGDHVWVRGGLQSSGVAFDIDSDLHLVGGFGGDETSVAQRHGPRTRLSGAGTVSSVLVAGAVDVTIAGFEIDGCVGDAVDLSTSRGRVFDLVVRDGAGVDSGGIYVAGDLADVVIARSDFRDLDGVAITVPGVRTLVVSDVHAESAGRSLAAEGTVDVLRSAWFGGGLDLQGSDARLSDVLFRGADLAVWGDAGHGDADLVAVDVTFAGLEGGVALSVGDRTDAWITGATFDGNDDVGVGACQGTAAVRNAVFWNSGDDDVTVTCGSGTATVTGSVSDRNLGPGNVLIPFDPFVRFASGEVLLDPLGDATDVGNDTAADEATGGYPAVGLDWRDRSATADFALDAAPVDPGAHVDPRQVRVHAFTAGATTIGWEVAGARRCEVAALGLVLDGPTTGSATHGLASSAEVVLDCWGAVGGRTARAWATVP